MSKVGAIVRKEWKELRQERSLILGTLFPPLALTIAPIYILRLVATLPPEGNTPDNQVAAAVQINPLLANLHENELAQALTGQQFGVLLLLMPLFIPSFIAAYSVVGEKNRRTLEPVLATPIKTWELLLAKCLASLIPAVVISLTCAAVFAYSVQQIAISEKVIAAILSPGWYSLLLLCAPLMSLFAVAVAVLISSRVSDPRTAQQLSATLAVPIMLLVFSQLLGFIVVSPMLAVWTALSLVLLNLVAFWLAVRFFQREVILTKWK